MSVKSEPKDAGSIDDKNSISLPNSVASDDGVEHNSPRKASALKYSHDFLLKLQKSKLSKKPPECLERLRQEGILREAWRTDKGDKDSSERDTEFPAALTKPPPSFKGGCKVDKAVVSETVTASGNGAKKTVNTKGEPRRAVGSGRLSIRERDNDFVFSQDKSSRRSFEHQHNDARRVGRFDANTTRDDAPEWFTEGPTSQTDTIELHGFDEAGRKTRNKSPIVREPEPDQSEDLLKYFDLKPQKTSPTSLVSVDPVDEELESEQKGGSRFMAKVFSKTKPVGGSEKEIDPSRDNEAVSKDERQTIEFSAGNIMKFFQASSGTSQPSGPALEAQSNGSFDAIAALLKDSAPQNKKIGMNEGPNLLELLMKSGPTQAPPPPRFAKSVEELEADLKEESRNNGFLRDHQQLQHRMHPNSQKQKQLHGNGQQHMETNLLNEFRFESGVLQGGPPIGHLHEYPHLFNHSSAHPHLYNLQPQPKNTHNNLPSVDIMRLFAESAEHQPSSHGSSTNPGFKQDPRNVPTQVLLQEKNTTSGPRPILKNNKAPPPPSTLADSRESAVQLLLPVYDQVTAHQFPSQHHNIQQHQRPRLQQQNSYYGGPQYSNGCPLQHPSALDMIPQGQSMRARPVPANHHQNSNNNVHLQQQPQQQNSNMHRGGGVEHGMLENLCMNEDTMMARWFGHLGCNQPARPVPRNVVRVEELENQNNHHRFHPQANPT